MTSTPLSSGESNTKSAIFDILSIALCRNMSMQVVVFSGNSVMKLLITAQNLQFGQGSGCILDLHRCF